MLISRIRVKSVGEKKYRGWGGWEGKRKTKKKGGE
jgi:hypothetical protein